ncbi:MAG TPA: sodium:calcium antiporter [Nitrospiria bacterium]|nr:sodium:calcium antiporter [Nitrospiria bacterium]
MITFAWLIGSLLLVLASAHLFTNGVEWLGKRLGFSHGIIGSILAGVGTALPETIIPVIAILFSGGQQDHVAIGVGAILGAPFMLTTLTLPLLGAATIGFAAFTRRGRDLHLRPTFVQLDLTYFLLGYGLAMAAALIPVAGLRRLIALVLPFLYGHYLWRLQRLDRQHAADLGDVEPLLFLRRSEKPPLMIVLLQVVTGLGGIVAGAELFVDAVEAAAAALTVSPLPLSLLITPVATELPEKFNSLIWLFKRRDALAVANITGAMVFQATFPVAIGLIGTTWQLDWHGWTTGLCTLAAAAAYLSLLLRQRTWHPWQLMLGATFYAGFAVAMMMF